MSARIQTTMIALAVLLAGAVAADSAAAPAGVTPRLSRALEANADKAAGPLAVWVNFTGRDLTGAALSAALREAESQLPPRLRERRLRLGSPVDAADLPVGEDRLAAVVATGAVLRRESRWLNAASFTATGGQIAAIAELPFVESIDLVGRLVRGPQPETTPEQVAAAEAAAAAALADKAPTTLEYGASKSVLDEVNIPLLHAEGLSGRGVTIAIFDTGFDLDHECLQDVDVLAAWDFVNEDPYVDDQRLDPEGAADHGTQILGSLVGYSRGNLIGPAYGASVILAKTEDVARESVAEEDNWIAALEWAAGLGADIVSSSVGYYDWYDWSDLDGDTAPITVAADLAVLRGTMVVVGVGMMRYDPAWPHILAPADGHHVLSVGMSDRGGFIAGGSSPGPTFDGRIKPDVLALGVGNLTPVPWTSDIYYFVSGTDMSVTLVTGAAALLLERNPRLTPLQVGEALRMTASRALLPDNDYGWGVVDALGASRYWQPSLAHQPLRNQPAGTGAFTVTVDISSRLPLLAGGQALYWRTGGGDWQRAPLAAAGGAAWTGTIPPQVSGRTVEYHFAAVNELGQATIWPDPAREAPFRFEVGTDSRPPVITHAALADQPAANWPPRVFARVEDDGAVDSVQMWYTVNGSPYQGPVALAAVPGGWAVDFPLPPGFLQPGARVTYTLTARDRATVPNLVTAGPFAFEVVAHLGRVLVIDDHFVPGGSAAKAADARGAVQVETADKAGAADYAAWLREAGYATETVTAENFTAADLAGHDVVFYTSGNYLAPLSYDELRAALVAWVRGGGRILVESGEAGYAALGRPEYAEFMEVVLRAGDFLTDDGFELHTAPDLAGHALVTRPHAVTSPLRLAMPAGTYDWGAADVFQSYVDCQVVMHSGYGGGTGGVVVHDDTTGPSAGQSVYLSFDLNYVERTQARRLLENAMAYLTSRETGGPSAVSGRVTVAGRSDHSGLTVTAGRGLTTTTRADGSYRIEGLWGGSYHLEVTAPGCSTDRRVVDLAEGEQRQGVDFSLVPVRPVDAASWPNLAIPDNTPAGVATTLTVGGPGTVMGVRVEVDIQHYAIGNLVVQLTSPRGTTVTLHDRSGGLADDLVGEWPTDLWVAGPGALDDFVGEPAQGGWTLTVSDRSFGATGRLRGWAVHLLVADLPAAGVDRAAPPLRLIGNAPNPFNPRTVISFELAAAGPVRLEIYDVRGQLVARLADGEYAAGRHSVPWADDRTASGLYFARLTAAGRTEVHKMTLLR